VAAPRLDHPPAASRRVGSAAPGRRGAQIEAAPPARHVWIGQEILQQRARLGVAEAAGGVAVQPLNERSRRRLPVHDEGADGLGTQHQPHRIRRAQPRHHGRVQEVRLHAGAALVHLQHVAVPVEHQRRVRLLLAQDEVERPAHGGHRGGVEPGAAVDGSIARRDQQVVALAQRHVQRAGQPQHHRAAGLGSSRLDEAQMTRGDAGLDREAELAQPALGRHWRSSRPNPLSVAAVSARSMPATLHRPSRPRHYLRGS
jgi:hypothetical protein